MLRTFGILLIIWKLFYRRNYKKHIISNCWFVHFKNLGFPQFEKTLAQRIHSLSKLVFFVYDFNIYKCSIEKAIIESFIFKFWGKIGDVVKQIVGMDFNIEIHIVIIRWLNMEDNLANIWNVLKLKYVNLWAVIVWVITHFCFQKNRTFSTYLFIEVNSYDFPRCNKKKRYFLFGEENNEKSITSLI